MIKKHGSKFVVTDKSGTKVLGTHPSKEKAAKQLAAIEISKAKHMKENTKRFKDFRNTLSESEYKETLTGYPNRSLDTDVGAIKFNAEYLANANAMLNALSKYTYLNPTDAFVKIKARLNVLLLDFPWTPRVWAGHGQIPPAAPEADNAVLGEFVLPVTRFGRVDGYDAQTGGIRFDGRAASQDGFQQFDLKVRIELGDDSMYRVTAKLTPKTEPVVAEEGVEHDGDSIDEMAQTAARAKEMERKIAKQDDRADRAYTTKMNSPSHKKAKAAEKRLDKTEKKVNALLAQDRKEYDSPRTYGRSGKLVKRGSRHEVKEAAELDEELTPARQAIIDREKEKASKALNKGKTAKERDRGYARGSRINYLELVHKYGRKSDKEGSPYQVNKRELNKWRKAEHGMREEVEQIDELSKATKDAYVAKRGSQLSSMLSGHTRGKQLTGKQQANAVKGIKQATGVKEEVEQIDEAGAAKLARMGYAYDRARIGSRGVNNPERKQQMGDAYYKQREKVEANKAKRVAAGTFDKERELEALHKKYEIRRAKNTVKEELVGGQKKLDVNKNKRLDAQDFALLRNKKKTVKEETVEEGKKFKAWTPRLDKLMANRDAVRSKPKKSILTQKVEGGKKIGAARPIAAFKEDVTTEFTTGLPVMEPALGSNIADQSGKGTKRIKKTVKEAATKKPVKKPSPHTGAANVIGKQKAIKDMLNKHGMRW